MEIITKKKKTFMKIGFNKEETAGLVKHLNIVLANYHLHYQKLRNFHWNVEGQDFFELHEKFEEQYNQVKTNIDMVAERIRVFDHKPMSNLSDYLKISTIKEAKGDFNPREMVQELLEDLQILLSQLSDTVEMATEVGDSATEDMMIEFIRQIEMTHWMFTAWLKKV